jgi:hypothetical protein
MVPVLTRGPVLSVGERERRGYRFGVFGWAVGLFWYWAEWFPRGPFHIFLFLASFPFLFFLNSLIDFAKMLQTNSIHFQKFCKIYSKVLNQ